MFFKINKSKKKKNNLKQSKKKGLCYQCSLDIWKKTGECYLCRKKIKKIVKIDTSKKLGKYKEIVGIVDMQEISQEEIEEDEEHKI
jgi:hypothetical protein